MNGDGAAEMLWGVGALVLVGSSLLARRIPLGSAARMSLAWVAIFGAVYVLFLFRREGADVWRRITADVAGESGQTIGTAMRIPQAEDGHFWVRVGLNGHPVRFLIDSGATVTTISPQTAAEVGIIAGDGPPVTTETANGTGTAHSARATTLMIGPIHRNDEPIEINDVQTDTNVLGMSFLSRLKSWRVEGATLTLQP